MPREALERKRETSVSVAAVILAGGSGRRFGTPVPKQFQKLAGRPVAAYAVEALRGAGLEPVIAVQSDWRDFCERELGVAAISGGQTRAGTVRSALAWAEARGADYLLLHAATRPFAGSLLMAHFLSHRHGWDALVCAEEIGGSVLDRSSGGPIDRRRFVLTTSPEMVAVRTLRAAVMSMEDDEVLAVDAIARTGGRVGLVYHDLINMKITRPGDLKLAEQLVRAGIMIGKIHAPVPLADREAVCAGHQ